MKRVGIIALCLLCLAGGGRKKERIETPQRGAVLQMGFNEGAEMKDWSVYGNDGTLAGGAWAFANGFSGGGFIFNGDGTEYISVDDSASLDITTHISFNLWADFGGSFPDNDGLISKGPILANQQPEWSFVIANGGILYFRLNRAMVEGSGDVNAQLPAAYSNDWHMYSATYDGANQRIYADGVLLDTQTYTNAINVNAHPLYLGIYFNEHSLDGKMDEVQILNRALSDAEIKGLYEQGKANKNP